MPFPDSPRVVYRRNPLIEVICQLRYNTVLRIDAELPAAFQEDVRAQFPQYECRSGLDMPPDVPDEIRRMVGGQHRTSHVFRSDDESWELALTSDFLALTCKSYVRWEQFLEVLTPPFMALNRIYTPGKFVRVGLRYRNAIQPATLGLSDSTWADLLNPYVAAEFCAGDPVASAIEESITRLRVALREHSSSVLIHHGLAVLDQEPASKAYLIDSDFFSTERTEAAHVFEILGYFNGQSGKLFRWCISDVLHAAMGPTATDQR
jgi:uncharacterized protein (TIGR04255 family)